MTASSQRWARLAAGLWLLFASVHVLGEAMTLMFRVRVGFWPVWFLDCAACSHPSVSFPYSWPILAGVSVPSVLATGVAPFVLVRSATRFGGGERAATAVLALSAAGHAVPAWIVRYPGSVPPVVIGTLLPAATVVAAGAALVSREQVEDLRSGRPRGGWRSAVPVALGVAGALALGGFVSALAAVAGIWAATTLPAGARRYAMGGVVLGVAGLTYRMTLVSRFWMFIDWFP